MTALGNAGALDLVADTVAAGAAPADARKWWLGELSRHANETGTALAALPVTPAQVARIAELVASGALNDRLARQVLDGRAGREGRARTRSSPPAASPWSATTRRCWPPSTRPSRRTRTSPARIRGGKTAAAGALVGAVMKATRGQADASRVRELILQRLAPP